MQPGGFLLKPPQAIKEGSKDTPLGPCGGLRSNGSFAHVSLTVFLDPGEPLAGTLPVPLQNAWEHQGCPRTQ